jgi:hypothetical protein
MLLHRVAAFFADESALPDVAFIAAGTPMPSDAALHMIIKSRDFLFIYDIWHGGC